MAGYTRVDTINNIADGNVINAADLDGEFDGVQAAFNSSTGHNHDGTAGEGAPILALGPVQDVTISTTVLGVKTTNTVDLGTTGLRFKDFYLAGNANIGGSIIIGDASADTVTVNGTITSNLIFTDNTYDIGASGATRPRNLFLSGTATVAGNTTLGDASTDTVTVNGTATFNASPIISVTDNTNAALRITQLGTGNALLVEDLTNPDSTPFVIDASGNVGIGTSSPAYKLDVFSTGSVSAQIAGSTRGTLRLKSSFAGTTDIGHFSVYNALDTRVFDIGTTSDDTATPTSRAEFSVSAAGVSTELMRLSGSVGTVFNEDGGDYDFRVESDTNTHALFVQGSDGNVGIGTSSPTSTLSVTGTANVTGNVTLGDASTDTVTVNGYMRTGGGAPNANICLRVGNTVTGSTSGIGLHSNAIADSGTTANYYGVYSLPQTAAAAFTLTNAYGYYAVDATKGAGSTITNLHGLYVADQTQGTNNYGVTSAVTSGTNKWNIYASGTAQNYFAGNVLVGTTAARTAGGVTPAFQVEGITVNAGSQYLTVNNATAGNSSLFQFNRSKGTALGDVTVVAQGDTLGRFFFAGADGTAFIGAASITAQVDATPGTNDMPGRLLFSTTADGASSPTERMRIDSAGNVGIGANSPSTKLEVAGSTSLSWTVTASVSGTTMDVTAVSSGTIAVGDLVFGTNIQAYTRVTALGTGTGGIGTYTVSVSQTSASGSVSGAAVYANTLIRITDTDTSVNSGQPTGGLQFYTSDVSAPTAGVGAYVAALSELATPDTALVFGTRDNAGGGIDANERMRIDSSGNVGIGTSSPAAKLDVRGSSTFLVNATNPTAWVSVDSALTTGSIYNQWNTSSNVGISGTYTNHPYTFVTNNTERMRINSSGNVGIGTTDTQLFNAVGGSTRLAVCGSSASTDILGNTGASISIINTDQTANNTAGLHFARADTDDTPNYAGASIVAQFPDAQVTGQYPKGLLAFLTSTTANTSPSEKMRIDSSGNLLVGTTSSNPSAPFNGAVVAGNFRTMAVNGTVSSAASATLFTIGLDSAYMVTVQTQNASGLSTTAMVRYVTGGNPVATTTLYADNAAFAVTISGTSVRITNTLGGAVAYSANIIRIF